MTIELDLPLGINDIDLRSWQKFAKLSEDNADAENDFLEIKMLEIFCGLKYKDIHTLPLGTFNEATEYLGEVFNTPCPLVNRFTMVGTDGVEVEFGFIPNLDKMTMGEYIDLNNYFSETETLHKAMAVLFRPIHKSYKDKESYRIDSYKGADLYSDILLDMPLGIALGAKVFFYRLGIKLSKAILNSILHLEMSEEHNLSVEEKKTLTANTAGIKNSMLLLEDKLLELTRQQTFQYMKQ
tara:strand:- start:8255 stop:8971 length:717 start_codon:yes stop_codon:yes gene_type:complete